MPDLYVSEEPALKTSTIEMAQSVKKMAQMVKSPLKGEDLRVIFDIVVSG